MNLRPLRALVAKDLRVFFSERHALVLSFVAPIALASFMAAVFGGAGAAAPAKIAIVVVDEDRGQVAASIITGARGEARLSVTVANRAEADAEVRTGRAVAAVVIPQGFGESAADALLGDATPPELAFLADPTRRSELSLAQGLLTRVVLEAVSAEALGDLGGGLVDNLTETRQEKINRDAWISNKDKNVDSVARAEFLSLFEPDAASGAQPGAAAVLDADREEFLQAFPGLDDWFQDGERKVKSAERPGGLRRGSGLPWPPTPSREWSSSSFSSRPLSGASASSSNASAASGSGSELLLSRGRP
jgi:hypothetical protein